MPAPALPHIHPGPGHPATGIERLSIHGVGDSAGRCRLLKQCFQAAKAIHPPVLDQMVRQGQVVPQQVEDMDGARAPARLYWRDANPRCPFPRRDLRG